MPAHSIHSPPEKIIESQLDEKIMAIEDTMQADVLTFIGSLLYGSEDVVRDQVEEISKSDQKREKIVVILETDGGNHYCPVRQHIIACK